MNKQIADIYKLGKRVGIRDKKLRFKPWLGFYQRVVQFELNSFEREWLKMGYLTGYKGVTQ